MTGNPRNVMVYDTPYLQNESKFLKKSAFTWDVLGANVLKVSEEQLCLETIYLVVSLDVFMFHLL